VREMLDGLIGRSTCNAIRIEVDPERLRPIDADLQVPDTRKFEAHTGGRPTGRGLKRQWKFSGRGKSAAI